MSPKARVATIAVVLGCFACLPGAAELPKSAGFGADPELPAPEKSLLPTVKIAPAVGWSEDGAPRAAAADLRVTPFARGLQHPRWLYVLPNGDVLVAETDAPDRPDDRKGIRGWLMKRKMHQAGSGTPSADRITLLRDENHDGVVDAQAVFASGLHSPFGMAAAGGRFYVADTDALLRFSYADGQERLEGAGQQVAELPGGSRNHHWTKSLVASPDGRKLYVGVGSNSNAAENGLAAEADRACILEIDAATGERRVYAGGLRNPVGMAWEPRTGALWVVVNERDELGDNLVPDYLTAIKPGAFYGWPWSYWGSNVDDRVRPPNPDMVAKAVRPDYGLGAHTASLGLASAAGNKLPSRFADGMFVGQHGSWNRDPPSGYEVIFVPFAAGKPFGAPLEVLGGFLDDRGGAMGRPVGVAIDALGGLLVADDVGGAVWRVTAAPDSDPAAGSPQRP